MFVWFNISNEDETVEVVVYTSVACWLLSAYKCCMQY